MQRPLIRRRHTVFPNKDLKQLSNHNFDEEGTATVDFQTRPGLDRTRKTQSFSQSTIITSCTLQHAELADFMADDTVTSPMSPTSGTSMQNEIIRRLCKTVY